MDTIFSLLAYSRCIPTDPNVRSVGASMTPTVLAMECIGLLPGGSQPKFMRCSDDAFYVVKFPTNQFGPRILANELLATRLAERIGLPVPPFAVVEVRPPQSFTIDERITERLLHTYIPPRAALCFGSRVGGIRDYLLDDRLSPACLAHCENVADFAGMLAFDKWTCNADFRQLVFERMAPKDRSWQHRALMIDQGSCFHGRNWDFHDQPRQGLCQYLQVYQGVVDIESFEPWLSRIEQSVNLEVLECAAGEIPAEWYGHDVRSMRRLLSMLNARRYQVRTLILEAVNSYPHVFPNWREHTRAKSAGAKSFAANCKVMAPVVR